jgi:hypothetical protein
LLRCIVARIAHVARNALQYFAFQCIARGAGYNDAMLIGVVLLVSSVDLPMEQDSLPLHIVGREPLATERQVAQLVVAHPALQELYGGWVATLHPTAWKEAEIMARATGKGLKFDFGPAIETLGWKEFLQHVNIDRVVEHLILQRYIQLAPADEVFV